MLNIKTWRNPYDTGVNITNAKEVVLNPGLTVLVGCNGAGKSTLLANIDSECKDRNIPRHLFDNLHDGGSSSVSELFSGMSDEDISIGASLFTASEGEAIAINIGRQASKYGEFFKTGWFKDKSFKFASIFSDETKKDKESNLRVLLFDATDSGLSIDNVILIKDLFQVLIKDANEMGLELYIIIAANEYELCRGEQCLDVVTGKYKTFKTYDSYRKFIIKSREKKEKRIEKEIIYRNKQNEKRKIELEILIVKNNNAIQRIKSKAEKSNRNLSYHEKHNISDLERGIREAERELGKLK